MRTLFFILFSIRHCWIYLLFLSAWSCQVESEKTNPQIFPQIHVDIQESAITDSMSFSPYVSRMPFSDGVQLDSGFLEIRQRGNSSRLFSKGQYRIETVDYNGSPANNNLLRLPEDDDWVLYGPYMDRSFSRNTIVYELYREMGRYAPRTQFLELYLKGEYQGIYVLTEKVKLGKDRCCNSQNETGVVEALYKMDRLDPDETLFFNHLIQVIRVSQDGGEMESSRHFEVLQIIDSLLINSDLKSSELFEYIDLDALVDYAIIQEFSGNIDAFQNSTYFHIAHQSGNEMVLFGPPWDFNYSMGLVSFNGVEEKNKFPVLDCNAGWQWGLLKNEIFKKAFAKRWSQLRANVFSEENIKRKVVFFKKLLAPVAPKDNEKWAEVYSFSGRGDFQLFGSFEKEMDYLLKWLLKRRRQMDLRMANI